MNIWRLMAHHQPERYEATVNWSRTNGVIAIGAGGVGDLRHTPCRNEHELFRVKLHNDPNATPSYASSICRSLWRFRHQMQVGDLVILTTDHRALVMRVTGDYFFVDPLPPFYYEHRRKAEPIPVDPNRLWALSGGVAAGENVRRTLFRCENEINEDELKALL